MERHWYLFVFTGPGITGEHSVTASCYIGYEDQLITMPRIAEAKTSAGVVPTATALSINYLGCMSKDTFTNGLK